MDTCGLSEPCRFVIRITHDQVIVDSAETLVPAPPALPPPLDAERSDCTPERRLPPPRPPPAVVQPATKLPKAKPVGPVQRVQSQCDEGKLQTSAGSRGRTASMMRPRVDHLCLSTS